MRSETETNKINELEMFEKYPSNSTQSYRTAKSFIYADDESVSLN